MKKTKKRVSIRFTNCALHEKLHYIAKYEGQSANAQILYLIQRGIEKYETEHGAIPEPIENEKR